MICPKCNEGVVTKVIMKAVDEIAYVCEYCDTIWFENDKITTSTGRPLELYIEEGGQRQEVRRA